MLKILKLIINESKLFFSIQGVIRPQHLSIAYTITTCLPLFIGQYFGHLSYGVMSSLGAMVFQYLPNTNLVHRMATLLCVSSLMTMCYFFGLVVGPFPILYVPVLFISVIVVCVLCEFFKLPPPGPLFFIMPEMMAMYFPISSIETIPLFTGLFFLGSLSSCIISCFYSIVILFCLKVKPEEAKIPKFDSMAMMINPIISASFVALSLLVGQIFLATKPYWIPLSCLIVLQASTLRAVWIKHLHRIIGTGIGLGVTYLLLTFFNVNGWMACILITILSYIMNQLITIHYATAVMFITPYSLLLVDAASKSPLPLSVLINARFIDTLIGCTIGLLGAFCLQHPTIKGWIYFIMCKILRVPEYSNKQQN